MAYVIAASVGAVIGLSELLTRYRDGPSSLIFAISAWLYLLINAGVSAAALTMIHIIGLRLGGKSSHEIEAYQILFSGFGSAALFRSSFFLVPVGGRDIGIGPSVILTGLLESADRGVDRYRAARRASSVSVIMRKISFTKANIALPTYCLALLKNVAAADQLALRNSVDLLRSTEMTDSQRSLALGLELLNIGGLNVLRAAVEGMGESIEISGDDSNDRTGSSGADTPTGDDSNTPLVQSAD
jgi:hypothetical protein